MNLSGSIGKSVLLSVGAGSLMLIQRYSDQQVPLNSKTHNSLRPLNPPNPRHLRSTLSQTEFASRIIPVP
jgi:hypothetical protein